MLEDVLRRIFIKALDLDHDADVRGLKYRAIDKWDSTAHMELIAALEEEFDITITNIDVIRINSFEAAATILKTKYDVCAEA